MERTQVTANDGTTGPTRQRHRVVAVYTGLTLAVLAAITALAAGARPLGASQPIPGISLFILLGFAALFALLALTWSYIVWANRCDRLDRVTRGVGP